MPKRKYDNGLHGPHWPMQLTPYFLWCILSSHAVFLNKRGEWGRCNFDHSGALARFFRCTKVAYIIRSSHNLVDMIPSSTKFLFWQNQPTYDQDLFGYLNIVLLNSNLAARRWWWFRASACLDVSGFQRLSRAPFSRSNWHLSGIFHFIPHFPGPTLFANFRQCICILSEPPINVSKLSAAWQNLI